MGWEDTLGGVRQARCVPSLNFRPRAGVEGSMLEMESLTPEHGMSDEPVATEAPWLEPEVEEEAETDETATGGLDAEALFSAALAQTGVLTREEELVLARQIVAARTRVHRLLKRARRVTAAALAAQRRGIVLPEQDFREREAVMILDFARAAARMRRVPKELQMDRPTLKAFVAGLARALEEYRELRDQMVRSNVRLVTVIARRYRHPTLSFLDLFQEGTIGLIRAVEKYDPERNIRFSTYATWWIWQQLGRAADTQGALIRTPVHWNQLRRRVRRDAQSLAHDNDGEVEREELAEISGLRPEVFAARSQEFQFVSTDSPLGDDDDRALESILPGTEPAPEDLACQTGLRRGLEKALGRLPEREQIILKRRFGLGDDEAETLEEIGERLGVSRERIRQLESRALKQLQEVCRAEGLQDYLN
jgi:RNA polymerase sigma factor (sigma-70 family)